MDKTITIPNNGIKFNTSISFKLGQFTLIAVMLLKEKIHWIRMGRLFFEMDSIGAKVVTYPIIVVIITAFHYAFAGMHFMFEFVMFLLNRKQFKGNMIKLHDKAFKTMLTFRNK